MKDYLDPPRGRLRPYLLGALAGVAATAALAAFALSQRPVLLPCDDMEAALLGYQTCVIDRRCQTTEAGYTQYFARRAAYDAAGCYYRE
jgi:hypothetical protein